jgi:copper transport protein
VTKRCLRLMFSLSLMTLIFVLSSVNVWGHAFVIKETPVPNSLLETSPEEVIITYNSKIERELVTIKVIDESKQEVTTQPAQLSDDQKEITLVLPELKGGKYKVEYYAVSSNDGHPVRGSYYFSVAENGQVDNTDSSEIIPPMGVDGSNNMNPSEDSESLINEVKLTELLIFFMRAVYFIGLLLMLGWVFWWRFIEDYSKEIKKRYLFWGTIIQMIHLVGLITMILLQLNIFTINGLAFTPDIPLGTTFGLMWLASLIMSVIGFFLLFRNKWFDISWVFIILLTKSVNSHSFEFEPSVILVISNMIHLLAASIWTAGLTFIIVFWRKQRLYVHSFLPIFSKYALWSIVILSLTGTFTALAFLSSFEQLFTSWGLSLLSKLTAVILVLTTGAVIRSKLRKHKIVDLGIWLIVDFILMMTIIIIVSILTYLNPLL